MRSSAMLKSTLAALLLGFFALNFMACEGPEGPEGPAGPAGVAGAQGDKGDTGDKGDAGQDGQDGLDGSTRCESCHDVSATITGIQNQWANSTHKMGGNYERNGTSCAQCHTHEGFVEYLETGGVAAPPSNPSMVQCRTCHNIHKDYAPSDYSFKTTAAVTMWNGDMYDKGKSNLCATCHQPRSISPWPEVGGPDVEVTSIRFGPHHGPQSALLSGQGGYEVPGSLPYSNTPHYAMIADGCVTCHMQEAYGSQAGGHTMHMAYEYHGSTRENTASCQTCHSGLEEFDLNGASTAVLDLGEQLRVLLEAQGLLDDEGYAIPGTMTADQAGALMNYRYIILEDRSKGIHNPKYATALLQNSIEAIQ